MAARRHDPHLDSLDTSAAPTHALTQAQPAGYHRLWIRGWIMEETIIRLETNGDLA